MLNNMEIFKSKFTAIARDGREFTNESEEVIAYSKAHPTVSPESCVEEACKAYEEALPAKEEAK